MKKPDARKSTPPSRPSGGTRVQPSRAKGLPARADKKLPLTVAPSNEGGTDGIGRLVERVKTSARASANARASASLKPATRARDAAAGAAGAAGAAATKQNANGKTSGAQPMGSANAAVTSKPDSFSGVAGQTFPPNEQSAAQPSANPLVVLATQLGGKGLPEPAKPIPSSSESDQSPDPLKKTQPPTNCVSNNDHLVKLGDAYACCRKNLLSIQKNVERLADFFAAMAISNNSTRYELIQSFEDTGGITAVPQAFQESLVMVGPGTSARMLMVARSAPGAVPALLPWFGYSSETDIEPTDQDSNQVYALAVPVGFWNSPQAVLETATMALKAIAVNVRTRVDKKDCCACLSKLTLSQKSKRKTVPGPLRHRLKKGKK